MHTRRTLIKIGQAGDFALASLQTSNGMDDIVELRLSKSVNVTNTSFIRAALRERMQADSLDRPPIELVQFHVFIHCTRGTGRHMVDFEEHEMARGTAIWIRPGQVQRWDDLHDQFDADVVVFESSSIPDLPLFERLLGSTATAHLGDDTTRLQQQMDWMADDLESTADHATAAAVVGVVLRLFARHGTSIDDETPARQLTNAFVESIEGNIHERSVAWHANQIGASTRTVARATRETLGQAPKDIIDASVILEARRRLAWSNDDIATIARALRFSEASNFTKFFGSRMGMSPSAFRQTIISISHQAK